MNARDILSSVQMKNCKYSGMTGTLAKNIIDNWLLRLKESNPAILSMFAERDKLPYRDLLQWSGEFAGKYLTGAYYIYRITFDERLKHECIEFCDEFIGYQDQDGYLGCYSKECHLTGAFSQDPNALGTWDAWAHYHWMFALLLWYRETGKNEYLDTVKRAAELFIKLFYNPESGNKRLSEIGWTEMNLSPIHVFALLYEETSDKKYIDFANKIAEDFGSAGAGDYINSALNGLEFYQCPKPRWESLHCIIGVAELYRADGNEKYLSVARQIFHSILKTDVHNTGGFSTQEQAIGNPYTGGPIETCCVIAYNALAVEILKLTGSSIVADHLERSHYNACMGMWSPTGRWSTYDTPMNGVRLANTTQIHFQSRPGSPELNCCSVNAARSIGMIGEWAIMESGGKIHINAYENAEYETENGVKISVSGGYPYNNRISVSVSGTSQEIMLRIPKWSEKTVIINGETQYRPKSGEYFAVEFTENRPVTVEFDFSTRFEDGHLELEGLTSIFRGPILFGTDTSICGCHDLDNLPVLSRIEISAIPTTVAGEKAHICLPNGVTLGDFYHLGVTGARYVSWLKTEE